MDTSQKHNGKRVYVGVSGGVDSSVALALLKDQGFDVTGVFLKVWSPDFLPCEWRDERRSAMRVCAHLGVPFKTIDCEEEYKKQIVDYMIREYTAGRTPNPDVFCNKYIKFGVFLKKALEEGVDFVATGHYAQITKQDTQYYVTEAVDTDKDQSYFLSELGQEELSHILFPIGHLTKPEVRAYAQSYNLPTAHKKDSQGLCFIGKVDMKDFLKHYIPSRQGNILNIEGEVIGNHDGSEFYTIGERHGFNLHTKTPHDTKLFVVAKDVLKNTITLGERTDEHTSGSFVLSSMHIVSPTSFDISKTYQVRMRYRQKKVDCQISIRDGVYVCNVREPQFGITPGQIAVFYDMSRVIGAGVIS